MSAKNSCFPGERKRLFEKTSSPNNPKIGLDNKGRRFSVGLYYVIDLLKLIYMYTL